MILFSQTTVLFPLRWVVVLLIFSIHNKRIKYSLTTSMSSSSSSSPPKSKTTKPHDPKLARRWMTHLAKHEKTKSIFPEASLLHIPFVGSHDAGTFGIETTSELAADLPEVLKKLPQFLNITARRHISTWSKCQHFNLFEQLDYFGARYFDLRVCPHVDEAKRNEQGQIVEVLKESLWLTHGSFSIPLEEGLDQILAFLEGKKNYSSASSSLAKSKEHDDENDKDNNEDENDENLEVFILDLQRITGFTSAHHYRQLIDHFKSKLANYLVPRSFDLTTPLKTLWSHGWRVFLLAQEEAVPNITRVMREENPTIDIIQHKNPPAEDDRHIDSYYSSSSGNCSSDDESNENNIVSSSPTTLHVDQSLVEETFIRHPPALFASSASSPSTTTNTTRNGKIIIHPECFSEYFHRRNALAIRSRWFNKRYKEDLYPRLNLELYQRSKTHPGERFQLHILQGIFTPNATDMLWSFGTGQSGIPPDRKEIESYRISSSSIDKHQIDDFTGRHSIWDFAKQINSDVITLWEDESMWREKLGDDNDGSSFFTYQSVADLKRVKTRRVAGDDGERESTRAEESPNDEILVKNKKKLEETEKESGHAVSFPQTSSVSSITSPTVAATGKFYSSSSLGFDPRNVLMIDFMEVGRSKKTGKNSFQVCFDLACRRFGLEPHFGDL